MVFHSGNKSFSLKKDIDENLLNILMEVGL